MMLHPTSESVNGVFQQYIYMYVYMWCCCTYWQSLLSLVQLFGFLFLQETQTGGATELRLSQWAVPVQTDQLKRELTISAPAVCVYMGWLLNLQLKQQSPRSVVFTGNSSCPSPSLCPPHPPHLCRTFMYLSARRQVFQY